jgi:hypothetical protein
MSFDLFHRAQQHPGLSQTQKGVLVALATFADGDGWCWPSIPTLASYAGVKDRAAQTAIADLLKLGLIERHPRPNESSKFRILWAAIARRGCSKDTGAGKTPVPEKHQGGVFPTPKDTSEDPNSKIPVKGPVEKPLPPKQEQGVQEVGFGPSTSPPPKAEEVQESPLLPLLMNAGLNLGAASGVINAFRVANVLTLADASTLDEWELGRIAGVNRKVATIKAFRAGGWLPPKERRAAPPSVGAGTVLDADGRVLPAQPVNGRALSKSERALQELQRMEFVEVDHGQSVVNP